MFFSSESVKTMPNGHANPRSSPQDVRLSESATTAVKDFKMLLEFMGKNALDEKAFNVLLDDMGYKRSRDGLFQNLSEEVAAIDGDNASESISVDDLVKLYKSQSYHQLDSKVDPGVDLMEFADQIFEEVDMDGSGEIDKHEARIFLAKIIGTEPSNEELDMFFDAFDKDKSGMIDRDEFKQVLLKPNKNVSLGIPTSFNYNLLHPTQIPSSGFVAALEDYCKNHRAVTHHMIENIGCASYGFKETADLILFFLSCYSKFNSGFVPTLKKLIESLDSMDHKVTLRENLSEEMGFYDEETLMELDKMKIPRDLVENIPHHELFKDLLKTVEGKLMRSYIDVVPDSIGTEMTGVVDKIKKRGTIGMLAMIYFGSELIVPLLYSSILNGLRLSCGISDVEARFLYLHIGMDQDHAKALHEIVVEHCETEEDRIEFVKCTEMMLNARVNFYDAILSMDKFQNVLDSPSAMYDKQATKWSRDEPRCLSDFTGRPRIFEMIKENVIDATVLDVGCGEGYVSRRMTNMGAKKVVGVDISAGMIESANSHKSKATSEHYIVGDSTSLKKKLIEQSSYINMMLGAQFDTGAFDLSVAVFLFNYMSISKMNKTFEEVYSLLKPGGHFIFSVPHPFIANHDTETFGFSGAQERGSAYFALRDRILSGHISTIDGERLNVRMNFKTIEDYTKAAQEHNFEILEIQEASVTAEHMIKNKTFFKSVNGLPLHLIVKLRKRVSSVEGVDASSTNTVEMLPKKLNWNPTIKNNIERSLVMKLPVDVNDEVVSATLNMYVKGIDVESIDIGRDIGSGHFKALKPFAAAMRARLLHETGAVIIKGLDTDALGGLDDVEGKFTKCSKIAYYLISQHIGTVDATARGRLFDVKSAKLDAMSKKADNVLFSVSDSEAGWHTDGASKDRVYDIVSLLCISAAAEGGKFRISNACDVFDKIQHVLPKFILYELTRPIPRDVLENGSGKGTVGAANTMSRESAPLALRIRYNSYPIYVVQGDRMRFRYMRHWIETGHEKTNWKVPTLLKIAMDILDDKLDEECCFHQALERGDMIFANNAMIAHARDQFKNAPDQPPRHKVRAWIQVQKANLLDYEYSDETRQASRLSIMQSLLKTW